MSRTFDPVLISRIFLALTYFRTWVVLFLFPIVVLSPDIALNFIRKLYFPTPVDVLCYNEADFKESQKNIKIQLMGEVVDPFKDDNISSNALNTVKVLKEREDAKDIYNPNIKSNILKIVSPNNNKEDEMKLKSNNKTVSESEFIIKKKEHSESNDFSQNFLKDGKIKNKAQVPVDKRKESVFIDDNFEIMEGK